MKIYLYGSGKIYDLWRRTLREIACFAQTIILTIFLFRVYIYCKIITPSNYSIFHNIELVQRLLDVLSGVIRVHGLLCQSYQ